jgi:hypothetical protein
MHVVAGGDFTNSGVWKGRDEEHVGVRLEVGGRSAVAQAAMGRRR